MRYAVFLRAINGGPANRLTMVDLRARVTALGFTDVTSHLQTGNLAVTSRDGRDPEAVAATLEAGLAAGGLRRVDAVVWLPRDVGALLVTDPFSGHPAEEWRQSVSFLRRPPERDGRDRTARRGAVLLHADERVILSAYPRSRPGFDLGIEADWRVSATTRWWGVVGDFHARHLSGDAGRERA